MLTDKDLEVMYKEYLKKNRKIMKEIIGEKKDTFASIREVRRSLHIRAMAIIELCEEGKFTLKELVIRLHEINGLSEKLLHFAQ